MSYSGLCFWIIYSEAEIPLKSNYFLVLRNNIRFSSSRSETWLYAIFWSFVYFLDDALPTDSFLIEKSTSSYSFLDHMYYKQYFRIHILQFMRATWVNFSFPIHNHWHHLDAMMVLSSVKYDKYNKQHNVTILNDTSKEASDHPSNPHIGG